MDYFSAAKTCRILLLSLTYLHIGKIIWFFVAYMDVGNSREPERKLSCPLAILLLPTIHASSQAILPYTDRVRSKCRSSFVYITEILS
ncbi:MAG: hypothetical protein ACJAUP_002109 [Cellvibrionaceae bacterium]|jgi:hypothetical protein